MPPDPTERVTRAPVIPVLTIARVTDAVPLARALVAGGLPVLEVTLRTSAALKAARAIAARLAAGSCWALTNAARPGAARSSASTWSCISETSGETTTVRSARMSAGSW